MFLWPVYLVLFLMCVFVGWPILRAGTSDIPWAAWLLFGSAILGLTLSSIANTMVAGTASLILHLAGTGVIIVASLISVQQFRKLPAPPSATSLGAEPPKSLGPKE